MLLIEKVLNNLNHLVLIRLNELFLFNAGLRDSSGSKVKSWTSTSITALSFFAIFYEYAIKFVEN